MLKLTSLALGLLTIIALAPASQAATNVNPLSLQKPAGDLHAQVIIKLGGEAGRRRELEREREVARRRELEREREAARRRELEREREAARRSYQSHGHRQYHGDDRVEYRRDR